MAKGTRPGPLPPASKPERAGRVCAHPGCETTLSVYNRSEHCWQHQDVVFPSLRGKRTTPGPAPLEP